MTVPVAVLLLVVAAPAANAMPLRADQGPGEPIAAEPLTSPAVLENESRGPGTVEVTLVASATRMSLVPGVETDVYAYNGTVPGPTLEVREGDRVIIHFRNDLPEETTVHWHGLHIPWSADGSPFHPVAAGESFNFEYTIPEGSAGTYWYHPHPHHRTAPQVAKGLYGAIIVRAADDPLRQIPEKLLILSDNRFLADGSIDVPDRHTPVGSIDFENGREGDVLFVNGQIMPTIGLRAGEVQRWRVVNASAARMYRLAIPGQELLHVGSDGGLFENPVPTDEILIAASERVELLVRGTGQPGTTTVLRDLPYDRYIPQTRPAGWSEPNDLLTVRYADAAPVEPVAIPSTLRRVEWLDTTLVTTTRVMVLTQGFINNRAMDMARVDETTTLGTTEIWQVENLVGMDHPFHLHGFSFQVLDRNGEPEPYASWQDTVNVPAHSMVRFVVRFTDYPGKWMFHCHILDHESAGMMGILEVR